MRIDICTILSNVGNTIVAINTFNWRTGTPYQKACRNSFALAYRINGNAEINKRQKMASVNPYLNFSGNAEEAFEFYRSVFGTEYVGIMRFKDAPDMACHQDSINKIMHVALPIGNGTLLMGSDRPSSLGQPTTGDSYYLSINADNEQEAVRLYSALSVGGQIVMPLEKAFWGSLFGMFTDKFGIQWMINYESNSL